MTTVKFNDVNHLKEIFKKDIENKVCPVDEFIRERYLEGCRNNFEGEILEWVLGVERNFGLCSKSDTTAAYVMLGRGEL
jgi:hypothetical protein